MVCAGRQRRHFDRWYSSGARLARVEERTGHEIELGVLQEIYTPEAKRFAFGVVDRAPTARLLLSVARHDRSPGMFQTIELALGVRGPAALGRQTTDFIHRLVPAPGIDWSRQIQTASMGSSPRCAPTGSSGSTSTTARSSATR